MLNSSSVLQRLAVKRKIFRLIAANDCVVIKFGEVEPPDAGFEARMINEVEG